MNIKEDYVSFETAKLLKEKGFDIPLLTFYITDKEKKEGDLQVMAFTDDKIDNNHSDICYLAPTLQMAMKWLREVHHWHIFVVPRWEDDEYIPREQEERIIGYQYVIVPVGEVNRKNEQPIITVPTPESAYEEAIKYCLENLV